MCSPPAIEITLEDFELYALDRLQVSVVSLQVAQFRQVDDAYVLSL